MILCHELQVGYWSIPKTGSTSIRMLLIKRFGGKEFGETHYNDLSDQFRHYYRFTVVRNPYPRLVSLYEHLRSRGHRAHHLASTLEFSEFVEWMVDLSKPPFLRDEGRAAEQHLDAHVGGREVNQWTFLGNCPPMSKIIRLENLKSDFHSLPFVAGRVPIPRINVSTKRGPWEEYYSKEIARLAYRYAQPDFVQFGYDPNYPYAIV